MTTYLVLTAIGDDKPGLVEILSEAVAAHGGNWLESSMSRLAGKFAGILKVSLPDANADDLIASLQSLHDDLKLVIEKVDHEETARVGRQLTLDLVGNDRPGIVREIARTLSGHGVNVEDLETECVPAPMTADSLFRAKAVLRVPAELDVTLLKDILERLADDLIVDINLQ